MNHFNTKNILTLTALSLGLVLSGCLTDSKDDDGGIAVADSLTTKLVTAGAQTNATYGSSIDIDNFMAYTINQAETREQDIDLIFAFSTSIGGVPAVYSPDTAKYGIGTGNGFDFMADFENPNTTVIKTVTVNFDSINTKEKLDSLWFVGQTVTNGRQNIVTGTTFMAKSNLNKTVLIRVNNVTTGADGIANFEGAAKF